MNTTPPPGGSPAATAPGRLPLVGHLPQLVGPARMSFMQSLRLHGPVVRIFVGPRPVYVLNSPEAVRQLLQVQTRKFSKGRLYKKISMFIGNGIMSSNGELHMRRRRAMQPAYHRNQVAQYVENMREISHRRIAAWPPGEAVSVEHEMRHLAGEILSASLFSGERARVLASAVEDTLPVIISGLTWRVFGLGELTKWIPTPGNRRFEAARARLRRTTEDLIHAYRTDSSDHGDLVSLLMATPDPGTGIQLKDDELRDEIITAFIAGIETVSTTLSWAMHVLSTHADIARRLAEEVDHALNGRPITPGDFDALPYMRAFINEVLRLHTPNLWLIRESTEAVSIEGTPIPAGAEVLYSPAILHRDPAWYPDPSCFDPERWLQPEIADLPRCAFVPFGQGNRRCIGDTLAMTEMTVVLATLVGRWRVEPTSPKRIKEVPSVVVHPSKGLAVRVFDRLPVSAAAPDAAADAQGRSVSGAGLPQLP
ncbi:cytochrome P450 [Streptomyces sp. NBC_01017]|uniref:cytochrome P450 n=1 Tax=Streptomyces sp. NBC_01017 TaxID=2903721 RepID=UPI0038671005|nr:cytochrome P450 [Streptomyces sp. NBC_01017]WSV35078.1 cytochrome P450 [Streptomyces sp. NBC_01017]